MTERLSEDEITRLIKLSASCGVQGIDQYAVGDALRELLARRAADPTPEQRAWYREMATGYGDEAVDHIDAWPDGGNLFGRRMRLAAHFGRLAMEGE